MALRLFSSDTGSYMQTTAIGLFYCSENELAAVRRHVPPSMTVTLYADEGAEIVCDFAIIGTAAVKRRAVLAALQEKFGSTPALLLLGSPDDDPSLTGDFAVLAMTELYRLPHVISRELRLHRAEVALSESERRYRELLESAREGVWVVDLEGTTTYANQHMADLLGVTVDALQRQSLFNFVDPEQRAIALTKLEGVSGARATSHEISFRRADGSLFWASVALSAVRDIHGERAGVQALVTDLSSTRGIEESLRAREMQLTIAQQLAQIGSWEWDADNDVITLSRELRRVVGGTFDPSGTLVHALTIVHADDHARLVSAIHRAAADGSMFDEEFRLMSDGTERVIHARGQLVPGSRPRRMIGVAQDITPRKLNEVALQQSEERYRMLVANIPEVIWHDDLQGRSSFISDNVVDLWGFTPQELFDNSHEIWSRHVHPADRERTLAAYQAMFERSDKYDVEYRFMRRDGRWVWIHNRAEIAEVDGKKQAFGVMSDITARRHAADELARSEARFRAVFEQANAIIYTVDAEGRFTSLNPAFTSVTGYSVADWIGHHFTDLLDASEVETATEHFKAVMSGERSTRDYRLRTSHGREVIVETAPEALMIDGQMIGTLGLARDVTLRRKFEREIEKEKRLASLGQLAASVAHEFNNVLMSILPFAELLKKRAPADPKVDTATRHIFQAIKRGRQVSQEIQRLARPVSSASLTVIDVRQWVSEVAREAQGNLGATYAVEFSVKEDGLFARGDLSLLSQVAANLTVNARDAMPNGGTLTIEASRAASGAIEIAISDSGHGIPEDLLDRIFDPLFTTKRSGTGLGLSIAHQAMIQQEGALRVASREGEGSTFTIVLNSAPPPAPTTVKEPKLNAGARSLVVGARRLVVVEDNVSVGEGIRELLIDEGFEVRLVTRGGEAVEAVRTFDPELVLLDVNLPDVSGLEVYEHLARQWPHLPVIFSTGHADARALDEVHRRDVPSIMKPYDIQELMSMMARVRAQT